MQKKIAGIYTSNYKHAVGDGFNGKEQFVLFENMGTDVEIRALETAHVLILNGQPLNEPVVHKGPFVMNTEAEIAQAYADARADKFGRLKAEQ